MNRAALPLALACALGCGPGSPETPVERGETVAGGSVLAEAEGREAVETHCVRCHSGRLVAQNRGNEDDWLKTIRRMQETQGLWELPPDDERAIVAYLARHYPRAADGGRRPPLAEHLMPARPAREAGS